MAKVICPYCGEQARLVRAKSKYNGFVTFTWVCYPCDAYVAAELRTKRPKGTMANAELRRKRIAAHKAFDITWLFGPKPFARSNAYKQMAKALGITEKECHIASFDIETCDKVVKHYTE